MKLGFKDLWTELDCTRIKNKLQNCRENFKNKFIKKIYTIAFIDDRYNENRYVISYCKLSITRQNQKTY